MTDLTKGNLDLEPIYTYLTENMSPLEFSRLLDEFLHDYLTMLIRIQLLDVGDKTIHEHTDQFLFYIKLLRDILPLCQQETPTPDAIWRLEE